MSESVLQFVRRYVEAWNAHDAERVAAFYAHEFQDDDVAEAAPRDGREHMRRKIAAYLQAFPDLHLTLDECVVEGNRVVVFWRWSGTHQGTFMRIPPTGRAVTVRGSSLLTLEEGHIRRALRIWDVAGLLRAIGLLPEL